MTERGMRGCPVIVNRLIDNVFWLICKDERKRRNDRLSEEDMESIRPLDKPDDFRWSHRNPELVKFLLNYDKQFNPDNKK